MESGYVWRVSFLPQLQDIEGQAPTEPQKICVVADTGKQAVARVEALAAKQKPGVEFQLHGLMMFPGPDRAPMFPGPDRAPLIVWVLDDEPIPPSTAEEGMTLARGEVLEADHGPGRFGIPLPTAPAPVPISEGKNL